MDERLFNNYKINEPKTSRTVDFSKRRGREENNKSMLDYIGINFVYIENQPDISKKHEQFYYK
jgi:hypothetical protein